MDLANLGLLDVSSYNQSIESPAPTQYYLNRYSRFTGGTNWDKNLHPGASLGFAGKRGPINYH